MVCCSMEENILCRHTNKLIDEPHCALTSFEGNNKYKPKNKKKQNRSGLNVKKVQTESNNRNQKRKDK